MLPTLAPMYPPEAQPPRDDDVDVKELGQALRSAQLFDPGFHPVTYIPKKNHLMADRCIMVHGWRGLSLWLAGPVAFRSMARHSIMVAGGWKRRELTSFMAIRKGKEGEK